MLVIAVAAAGAAASSAQAAVHTVTARDDAWWPSTLTIAVGDTVRWVNEDGFHNLVLDGPGELADFGDPGSPEWNPPPERAFAADATLGFVCQAHGGMTGTIKVGAGGTPPPPGGGGDGGGGDGGGTGGGSGGGTGGTGGGSTGGGSAGGGSPQPAGAPDAVRPVVRAVRAKAKGRAVRLGFRLSEAATVTVKVKRRGARKPVKTVRVRLRAGVRAVKVKRLRPGRYTFEISARDAAGNRSSLKRASLSLG